MIEVELVEDIDRMQRDSLPKALWDTANMDPEAPAIYEEGGEPILYGQLWKQLQYVRRELCAKGITQTDCVAVTLPRSSDLAVTLLGVACAAVVAPLNADFTVDEMRSYIRALKARAVVTVAGSTGEAAASVLEIPVLTIVSDPVASSGWFQLYGDQLNDSPDSSVSVGSDICAIFLTSGTTSSPKRVPLTHRAVLARAQRTIDAFGLTNRDRLLDPMPQTSAYSLVSGLLPTLLSGGSAMIVRQFEPVRFFRRAREFSATWSIATPPHLQAILLALEERRLVVGGDTFRVLRCGTGHLAERVANSLEVRLGIPISVGYGMVESGQIASSPVPPERRKPGSVGYPSVEIKLVDMAGNQVGVCRQGEILVRGPQVFSGYLDDPDATEQVFTEGWLRTGDLGYLDEEGHLFLLGRIKEVINRGGLSISPIEIDDVLLAHPDVAEAAAFGITHEFLGDEVAAAVVLKPESEITEKALIQHVASRLSVAKVPRRIFLLSDLPETSSGKISRRHLSARFSESLDEYTHEYGYQEIEHESRVIQKRAQLLPDTPCARPITPVEKKLVSIWAEGLGVDEVGILDGFLDLGGDSLKGTELISRIHDEFGIDLPIRLLFDASNIAELAPFVAQERFASK